MWIDYSADVENVYIMLQEIYSEFYVPNFIRIFFLDTLYLKPFRHGWITTVMTDSLIACAALSYVGPPNDQKQKMKT